MTSDSEPLTISDAAPRIRHGGLTPSDLLEQCLARGDRYEPAVKAWAYLDRERARQDAAQLTDEAKAGRYRGPLHGIPVGVKDIIDVFDMPTGCGSKRWASSYARRDAACVERLRQAGAVVVGKTVTTPFAFFDPPPTRNPWNLDRTPGGSSSGSAAAVACGMVLAALGTQTGGSITRPASYCGVCSLKPTHGRVSVDGVLPFAPTLDHVGVMANCVRDLATVFEVIAGPDPRLGWTVPQPTPVPDCTGLRVELPSELSDIARTVLLTGMFDEMRSPAIGRLFDGALHRGRSNDYLRETAELPAGFTELHAAHRAVMASEVAAGHGDRPDRHPDDYPQHIRALIEEGRRLSGIDYRHAMLLRESLTGEVTQMLHGPRVFVTPATTDLPPDMSTTGRPVFNSPWSFTGHPTVSVPAGWSEDGLPFSVQLVGSPTAEGRLLAVGAWFERGLNVSQRLPPVP